MNKKEAIDLVTDYLISDESESFYEMFKTKKEALEQIKNFRDNKYCHAYIAVIYLREGNYQKLKKEILSFY